MNDRQEPTAGIGRYLRKLTRNRVGTELRKLAEIPDYVWKPLPREARADNTTKLAHEIISAETSARDAKTTRLKALRLEKEATIPPVRVAKKTKKRG